MNFGGTIRLNRVGICIVIGVCILFVLYMNTNSIDNLKNETGKDSNTVNLRRLLLASIEVAAKGGDKVVAVRKEFNVDERSKGQTKEGVNDPVTAADYSSHCVMFYGLQHSFPKLKIISEEKSLEEQCTDTPFIGDDPAAVLSTNALEDQFVPVDDITVWIDPLDATKEYTENLLTYVATMVCVAIKGKPIIGVIHKPFGMEPKTTWAWVDRAVSENLKQPKQSETYTDRKIIIVSRSHAGLVKNITEQAFSKDVEIISAAGAGYKVLEVAGRNVTAYLHTTAIKKWDICPGNAILNALGGKMTTLSNEELGYLSEENVVNTKGLLATLENHEWYLEKLQGLKI